MFSPLCIRCIQAKFDSTQLRFLLIAISLKILLLGTLTGCEWVDDDDDPNNNGTPSALVNEDPIISFTVVDENGDQLRDAVASSSDFTILSQAYDSYDRLTVSLDASSASGIVEIEKPGHITAMLYFDGIGANQDQPVTLPSRSPIVITDHYNDGEYTAKDGAAVALNGDSLEREDGQAITGSIDLFITPIDISDPISREAFPGSYLGLAAADTEPGDLFSFGVAIIDLENNGVPLQLQQGQTAEVVIPIYADTHADGSAIQIGDQIPFWILNEITGVWEEESTGVVVASPTSPSGFGLRATTSHFSAFNADIWGGRLSGQNGPAGNGSGISLASAQWCNVFVTITDMDHGQDFDLSLSQALLGGMANSSRRSGRYNSGIPIEFSVLQNSAAFVKIWETGSNRKLAQGFRCQSERLDLTINFEDTPAFLNWFVTVKPVFEILSPGGGYEVVGNEVRIGNSFGGDADNLAEVSSNLGVIFNVPNGVTYTQNFLPSDPSPATFATYLSNDAGETAEQLDSVEYISESTPIVNSARVNFDENGPVFEWDADGADLVNVYHYAEVVPTSTNLASGTFVDSVVGDAGIFALGATGAGANGYFQLEFINQYGNFYETLHVVCVDQPNADLPPCQVAQ